MLECIYELTCRFLKNGDAAELLSIYSGLDYYFSSVLCLVFFRKRQRTRGDDDDALVTPQAKRSSTTLQCSEGSREAWESEVRHTGTRNCSQSSS